MIDYPAFVGALDDAPPEFLDLVDPWPVSAMLRGADADWAAGCYVPARELELDADLAVLFQPFLWDEDAPRTWMFSTLGLSALEQDPLGIIGRRTFRSFELAALVLEPPGWEGFRGAWELGELETEGRVPDLILSMARVAHEFASWIRHDRSVFGFGDAVQNALLAPALPSVLLVPPVVELLSSGLCPYRTNADGAVSIADVAAGRWSHKDELVAAADMGFMHLAPIMRDEFDVALQQQGWKFFTGGLLPTDEELDEGHDASWHIANLERTSRLPAYRAWLATKY